MSLAEALAAIVLITLQLAVALSSVLQIEFIVASFLDQASLHPPEEIWLQRHPFFFALESGRPDFWKIRSTLFWALVLRIRA